MPAPTARDTTLQVALFQILDITTAIKAQADTIRARLASTTVDIRYVKDYILPRIIAAEDNLTKYIATPNINSYALQELPTYTGVLTDDVNAVILRLGLVRDWIVTNVPTANGYMQTETLNPDGTITYRLFSPQQTLGLQNELQTLAGLIA